MLNDEMEAVLCNLNAYIQKEDSISFSLEMDEFKKWVDTLEDDIKKVVLLEMFPKINELLLHLGSQHKMAEDFLVNVNNQTIAIKKYSKF